MSMLLLSAWLFAMTCSAAAADRAEVCGLYGRVQIVDSPALADYRVKFVDEGHAQLRVLWVTGAPSRPGEWQLAERFVDFTIWLTDVDARADVLAASTTGWPGCR